MKPQPRLKLVLLLFFVINLSNLSFIFPCIKHHLVQCQQSGKVEKTDPQSADLTHWPHSADYPTDYSTDYPPRPTLNNQPNYFYGEEKHKKPTCSHVHDHNWKQPPFSFHRLSRPSLFHFRPILHRPPAKHCVLANVNVDGKHLTQI